LIMAIINASPDSFSGDGAATVEAALNRADTAIREGADILDIGAESTRPGATPLDADTEWARLEPILTALRSRTALPLSVDTYKASVAAKACEKGVTIINDVSGCRDAELFSVAAHYSATLVLTHNPHPGISGSSSTTYTDVVREVSTALTALRARAHAAGLPDSKLWFDPGFGFGKNVDDTLTLLRGLPVLQTLGLPLLVGVSNKSFIGQLTGAATAERLGGTLAAELFAATHGAGIIRTHRVAPLRQALFVQQALHAQNQHTPD
ncbi:MAG: dihydropteroate synthase, partial [Holosporales bacterium]